MTTTTMPIDGPARIAMTAGLRRALLADVALTGAAAVLMLAGAAVLDGPLGLPAGLLAGSGAFLLLFVAGVAWVASRSAVGRLTIQAIIEVNLLWFLASVIVLFTPWPGPTGLGVAFIAAQAIVVLGLAWWQFAESRRGGGQPSRLD